MNTKAILIRVVASLSGSVSEAQTVKGMTAKQVTISGYSGDADPPCPVMLTPHKDYGSKNLND